MTMRCSQVGLLVLTWVQTAFRISMSRSVRKTESNGLVNLVINETHGVHCEALSQSVLCLFLQTRWKRTNNIVYSFND